MGIKQTENEVYLLDYGLSRKYTNGTAHIRFSEHVRLVGTLRYCSLNCQKGYEQSRRDDLESLGFCLIYMLKGRLPWQGTGSKKGETKEKIYEIKASLSEAELCSGQPKELREYLEYCRGLKFEERPSYGRLRKLFQSAFLRTAACKNFDYDWSHMKCDLSKRNVDVEGGSNLSNYEDEKKCPQREMSRKIEIHKLASGVVPNLKASDNLKDCKRNAVKRLGRATGSSVDTDGDKFKVSNGRRRKSQGTSTETLNKEYNKFLQKSVAKPISTKSKDDKNDLFCNFDQTEITKRDYAFCTSKIYRSRLNTLRKV
eukprot:TRINITY_DN3386_c0_g1_i1.p1 TRINITY_DN3386_c0_g1~~TRINITY_DN3386_c0_g1_i1.p1  ORF type:complete len:313 (+),score=54.59 TRINITY_DN3386_c0_g1_i1:557-1495(+)